MPSSWLPQWLLPLAQHHHLHWPESCHLDPDPSKQDSRTLAMYPSSLALLKSCDTGNTGLALLLLTSLPLAFSLLIQLLLFFNLTSAFLLIKKDFTTPGKTSSFARLLWPPPKYRVRNNTLNYPAQLSLSGLRAAGRTAAAASKRKKTASVSGADYSRVFSFPVPTCLLCRWRKSLEQK